MDISGLTSWHVWIGWVVTSSENFIAPLEIYLLIIIYLKLVTCSFSDAFNTYFSRSIALNQYNCCLKAVIMLSNTDPGSRLRRMNKDGVFGEVEPSGEEVVTCGENHENCRLHMTKVL